MEIIHECIRVWSVWKEWTIWSYEILHFFRSMQLESTLLSLILSPSLSHSFSLLPSIAWLASPPHWNGHIWRKLSADLKRYHRFLFDFYSIKNIYFSHFKRNFSWQYLCFVFSVYVYIYIFFICIHRAYQMKQIDAFKMKTFKNFMTNGVQFYLENI